MNERQLKIIKRLPDWTKLQVTRKDWFIFEAFKSNFNWNNFLLNDFIEKWDRFNWENKFKISYTDMAGADQPWKWIKRTFKHLTWINNTWALGEIVKIKEIK